MIRILFIFSAIAYFYIVGIVSQRYFDGVYSNQNCSFPITKLRNQTLGHSKQITTSSVYTTAYGLLTFNASCPLGSYFVVDWSLYPDRLQIRNARYVTAICCQSSAISVYQFFDGYYFDYIGCIGTFFVVKF